MFNFSLCSLKLKSPFLFGRMKNLFKRKNKSKEAQPKKIDLSNIDFQNIESDDFTKLWFRFDDFKDKKILTKLCASNDRFDLLKLDVVNNDPQFNFVDTAIDSLKMDRKDYFVFIIDKLFNIYEIEEYNREFEKPEYLTYVNYWYNFIFKYIRKLYFNLKMTKNFNQQKQCFCYKKHNEMIMCDKHIRLHICRNIIYFLENNIFCKLIILSHNFEDFKTLKNMAYE